MFNLESEIAQWKKQLTRAGLTEADAVDELEEHLRSEVGRQVESGVAEEKAFAIAVERLGEARTLAREFEKLPANQIRSKLYPAGSLRFAFLALALGIALGGRQAGADFLFKLSQFQPAPPPEAKVVVRRSPASPVVFPSVEKVLARLQKRFDEAVVVVLADQTYDDSRKVILTSTLEVWKGPQSLAGKSISPQWTPPPASYPHSKSKERVLMFLPVTPTISSYEEVYFSGDALRMNPVLTISALKSALVAGSTERLSATRESRKSWLTLSRELPSALAKAEIGQPAVERSFNVLPQAIDEPPLSLSAQAKRMEDLSVAPYYSFAEAPPENPSSLSLVAQSEVADRLAGVLDGSRRVMLSLKQSRRLEAAQMGD